MHTPCPLLSRPNPPPQSAANSTKRYYLDIVNRRKPYRVAQLLQTKPKPNQTKATTLFQSVRSLASHTQPQGSTRMTQLHAAFLSPSSVPVRGGGTAAHATCSRRKVLAKRGRATTTMVVDPAAVVGTGSIFVETLKGVHIGPSVNEVMAAFCGGTVGVMSTIIALEVRRQRVKERKQCPYCHGTGKLPCGSCYTLGSTPSPYVASAQESCPKCEASGYLICNHVRHIFSIPTLFLWCFLLL